MRIQLYTEFLDFDKSIEFVFADSLGIVEICEWMRLGSNPGMDKNRAFLVRETLLNKYKNLNRELDVLGELANAPSLEKARLALDKLRDFIGLDYLELTPFATLDPLAEMQLGLHTDRIRAAVEEYVQRDLANRDPMMEMITQKQGLFFAGKVFQATKGQGTADEVLSLLRSAKIQNHAALGLADRSATPSILLAAGSFDHGISELGFETLMQNKAGFIRMAGLAYVDVLKRTNGSGKTILLTPAEAAVLSALSEGRTAKQIAYDSGKSLHTVRKQIASARSRIGAKTAIQAVSLAQTLGLIRS